MGFAGSLEPNYMIPTCIAVKESQIGGKVFRGLEDLDFKIGYEAIDAPGYQTKYIIKSGLIDNWDYIERYTSQAISKYLKIDPESHYFLMTEPPLNPPENREYLAEIMFESMGVPGLYIAVQAMLALAASWTASADQPKVLTGVVIDSGDGVTHAIPVADGYVVGSCIQHIPIAGYNITQFLMQILKDRETDLPTDSMMDVARELKEKYCYVCSDVIKEYAKYDSEPDKMFKKHQYIHPSTKKSYNIDVGYERFLAPEIFFAPEFISADFPTPLPEAVDSLIQNSPIDIRRGLYKNITLSGGSTMFSQLDKRISRDINKIVKARYDEAKQLNPSYQAKPIEVKVVSHKIQRYAVWFGGSMLASAPEFYRFAHTKAEYNEIGPSICRHNPVFGTVV